MKSTSTLHRYLDQAAELYPDRTAIVETDGHEVPYYALADLSDRLRDRIQQLGVCPGDRVGIYSRKSVDTVAAIFGILKSGAAYVPVDPIAPVSRNSYILCDCSVRAVIVEKRYADDFLSDPSWTGRKPALLLLEDVGKGVYLDAALKREEERIPAPAGETVDVSPDDLAYILYTSGSTGRPKGVMHSHGHATNYIDWCTDVFQPTPDDRFSSHAPFHFDLSILDIYTPIKSGATLVLIDEDIGKDPVRLASLIVERGITVWYSTPSVLSFLVQFGQLDGVGDLSFRCVLFAGEVFPVKHLRMLKNFLPNTEFYNLYGPTETNVCTFYKIPHQISDDREEPFPIGKPCSKALTHVIDDEGNEVSAGQAGELCVSGPPVMLGYWNLPEQTSHVFFEDDAGLKWYRTGDLVIEAADGNYIFLGRQDRMVKKRGYRVELGEIEAALYGHPLVKEAAVIAIPDEESGVKVKAFVVGGEDESLSIIDLKAFCVDHLPIYMVPDIISFKDELPKTSTDKMDYQKLKEIE